MIPFAGHACSLNGLDSLKPLKVKISKSNEKGTKRIIRSGGKEQDGGRIRLGKTGILVHRLIKESFRLHPVTPLLLPHEAMQECIVNGYHIPRKAQVTISVWAIGRDPNVWKDAEEFIPERYIGTSKDLRGHVFQLLPFGAGRRRCPGMQLGLLTVWLVVTQLVLL